MITTFIDFLFPPVCILCGDDGASGVDLCPGCRRDLPALRFPCMRCGHPSDETGSLCGACLTRPPPWEHLIVPQAYREPADWLVQQFKFHGRMNCGRLLGQLLADAVNASDYPLPDMIVPVPLHAWRLRERGFNQAAVLARRVGLQSGVPVMDMLERSRATEPQSALPAKARAANVRGAFSCSGDLRRRRVALVDDVLTTGHTATECVRVLKRAGAEQVDLWVAARALPGPGGRHAELRLCA